MSPVQLAECALIGLVAGVTGGLAGVGGSMIMLPGLHAFFGEPTPGAHHMYMAAAMTVNVAVALPASRRYAKLGTMRSDLLPTLLVSTIIFVILGVLLGNIVPGRWLALGLAAFLVLYAASNIARLLRSRGNDPSASPERTGRAALWISGALTGLVGGLLGLGGGVMLVPMLQLLCRVPLKQSIATSSGVICVTALFGAALKLATLSENGESWASALLLAAVLAPTAMIGGWFGASLTHRLPVGWVRLAITALILIAAARLAIAAVAPPTTTPTTVPHPEARSGDASTIHDP